MAGARQFVRENVFLVAAVLLPLVVVALFLVASAIPRWLVPPPQYDLLLRASGQFDQTRPNLAVEYAVRNDQVEATVRFVPGVTYSQIPRLFLLDHRTMNVREIRVDLPTKLSEGDPPVTLPVAALAGRRVRADAKAPDGYEFKTRTQSSPGLVGDLFGMNRYGERASIVKNGRVVPIPIPSNEYVYGVALLGWVLNEESR